MLIKKLKKNFKKSRKQVQPRILMSNSTSTGPTDSSAHIMNGEVEELMNLFQMIISDPEHLFFAEFVVVEHHLQHFKEMSNKKKNIS